MDKINYYLYHIPGKKIGVTRDLISRVVDQQGYSLDEVEVLEQSTDINYISDRELELQQSYGYRVDRQKYKDLYINKPKNQNKMYINATEQTSTFPVPVSKLKGRLMDMMGKTWETMHGEFEINMDTICLDNEIMLRHPCTLQKDLTYIIKHLLNTFKLKITLQKLKDFHLVKMLIKLI